MGNRVESPILKRGLRDKAPKAPSVQDALLSFALRAYDFWSHPGFSSSGTLADRALICESMLFRLRPILMMEGDDCSLWRTFDRIDSAGGFSGVTNEFRERYDNWFDVDDLELLIWWPKYAQVGPESPPLDPSFPYRPGPVVELWDKVYGDGPHSDHQRLLRNKYFAWSEYGRAIHPWLVERRIACMAVVRPLVIDVYNEVLTLIAQEDGQ